MKSPTAPTAEEAANYLDRFARSGAEVAAAGSGRYAAWQTGIAAASSFYALSVGQHWATGNVPALLVATGLLLVWVATICFLFLPGARATRVGFSLRFGLTTGLWGMLLGLILTVGFTVPFQNPEIFWASAALILPVPLLIGAALELKDRRND